MMLDVAIVGGGLCGLALGRKLEERGFDFALYEARTRFGGRILSRSCPVSAMDVDLGAAWFWPDSEPLMRQWVAELGLHPFPQHDDGTVLVLTEPDKPPAKLENQTIHAGAQRLGGGMSALIRALLAHIPHDKLHLAHVLTTLSDRGDHVELSFQCYGETATVAAKRVVLAIPPRLAEEHVCFVPNLDAALLEAMLDTPTFMATQAKAVMTYGAMLEARQACGSGNAFVHHGQAVLSEIYDAGTKEGDKTALGGFLALPPELRKAFHAGLDMLIASQFAQVFGPGFEQGELHYQDWACEPFTCASQDRRAEAPAAHSGQRPELRASHWDGKLLLAGSETAEIGAHHMEGALNAAMRVERMLAARAEPRTAAQAAKQPATIAANPG